MGVNHQSVINWVNAHAEQLPYTPPNSEEAVKVAELDELFTFVGAKKASSMLSPSLTEPADVLSPGK